MSTYEILPPALPRADTRLIHSSRDGELGGGVTYELQYMSRVGQEWILIDTKTPNKTLLGLLPGHTYDFRVRALNSTGWGEFSPVTEFRTPSDKNRGGGTTTNSSSGGSTDTS